MKYKLLLEKAKSKDFKEGELPEYDDSNGFTNLIKPLLNIDEIESMQVKLSTKRSANETPFNSFGGLKKKTEAKAKVVLRDLMM